MSIRILTDPGCGLVKKELQALRVTILPYVITHGPKTYVTKNAWDTITHNEQLKLFEEGNIPSFSRPPLGDWTPIIKSIFDSGDDILYLAISQKTSNSISSINLIGNLLKEEYPDRVIKCIDTKLIGRAQGYLVKKAVALSKEDFSLEEIAQKILELKNNVRVVWLPRDRKVFQGCNRGDASSIENAGTFGALTCGPEGEFIPWKTFMTRYDAISYLEENFKEYPYVEISYTVGTNIPGGRKMEEKEFNFEHTKFFHMPPFTSSALGIDAQEYTFIKE